MKHILFLAACLVCSAAMAQDCFEGEIVFKSNERYSETVKKSTPAFDGEHTIHVYVKGNKMHSYDELTTLHILYFDDTKEQYSYYDINKTGINQSNQYDNMMLDRKPQKGCKITVDEYAPTGNRPVFLDKECEEWKGRMCRSYGMAGTYDIEYALAFCDIKMPPVYRHLVWGIDTDRLSLRYALHYSVNGSYDCVTEYVATEINEGEVDDSVFVLPADYKIIKNTSMVNQMKFYKATKEALKAVRGIK